MATYFRGPVCGVDNCPSRLWRIVDGRRVCQYGHVMEGDVELNNEDDDVAASGVITRRLNLSTNATGNFQSSLGLSQSQRSLIASSKTEKLYGRDGKLLFLKSFQYILKKQTEWLILNENFPESYSELIKLIWTMHLKQIDNILFPNSRTQDNGREAHGEDTDMRESSYGVNSSTAAVSKLKLSMLTTIAIHYLACLHLGLPITSADILRWACVEQLPYFGAYHILPREWQEKLPNYYMKSLDGGKPPHEAQVQHKVAQSAHLIRFSENFHSTVIAPPILLKLTLWEKLPMEFYLYAKSLLSYLYNALEFPLSTFDGHSYRKAHQYTELKICSAFIASIKLKLLAEEQTELFQFGPRFAAAWLSTAEQRDQKPRDAYSRARSIMQMTYTPAARFLDNGLDQFSETNTEQYLDWIQSHLLSRDQSHLEVTQTLDEKLASRKLHSIIPLPTTSQDTSPADATPLEDLNVTIQDIMSTCDEPDALDDNNDTKTVDSIEQMIDRITTDIALNFGVSIEQMKEATDHIIVKAVETWRSRQNTG